ncbi:MAG: YgeY family selenium metabolism-linked hydrolase [Candidatus Thermofonsia Clade 1 bacterium]|jgi:putative selenium metabolism hydrolase|uniref:YgeY family selenium metabolism-linked hydrolase n=1 Tax=Candidatus Thermofonsia Clade 1 bacterium TaxID=2364210 RepID=A0A2M8PDN3_9CHLR|nr:MAG: YgeY family selenium metabolism-linked hydrolase [Candidatus Thermofonsia Clade 1 bacterium]RMF53486.1 MAG: YgeY family selenium metabolism-linked hydrolase [Chloroflexota bacterium]
MLSEARREQILAIAQSLVRIPSLAGEEGAVIEQTAHWMRELGYDDLYLDECGNLVGVLRGSHGATVIYDSHVDTVAAGDLSAWRYDPFGGTVADGKLYGRGACDMKGSLAAALAALAYAKHDGVLRGTALVSASVGEEVIEGLAFSHVLKAHPPDLVVICESTALRLVTAGRGRAEITLTTHGKSAHASTPQLGVNALKHMARLVEALDALVPPEHARLGKGILEPTEIISAPYPSVSVLPYECRVRYDRRVLLGETAESVLEPIQAVIAALSAADPTFRAEAHVDLGAFTCYTGLTLYGKKFQAAWQTDAEHPFVRAAQAALRNAGQAAEIGHYNFCTNGSYAASIGLPVIGYGAGLETTAHIADEYVALDQLFGAAEGYYALATAFGR